MSTFTISVQELFESEFNFGLTADDYPIFRESARGVLDENQQWQYSRFTDDQGVQHMMGLNRFILDHYWHYEIGFETDSMFRFYLNKKMREIMPYYNQLFMSETLKFDPFQTSDTVHTTDTTNTEDDKRTEDQGTTATTKTSAANRAISSQFPQTMLAGNGDYASSGADNNAQTESEALTSGTGETSRLLSATGKIQSRTTGSQGHSAALLMQYRRSFLNINMMIVNELSTLFMMVMDTNDSHTNARNGHYGALGFGYPYFFPGI